MNFDSLDRLTASFASLPGVGQKTAQRYAYAVLKMNDERAREFSSSILAAKEKIKYCALCGAYTELEVCDLCKARDGGVICVVKEPQDIEAFERLRDFNGVYHVLHGTLDPMAGITPEDINIGGLLKRLNGVSEVIMATNPDVEGEATAMYIARLIKPLGIKVTRLAHGIPIGADVRYADEVTLSRAFVDRREY